MKMSDKEAVAAKALQVKAKSALKSIRKIQQKYPGISLVKILVRFRIDINPLAEWLVISRIEKHQEGSLSVDERIHLEQQKIFLRENHPESEKDCAEFLKTQ